MHIVFDLDGTLIDSVGDLAASASELVTERGGRPLALAEVADMVGEGAALLVRRALAAAGLDPDTPGSLPRFLEIYDRRLLDSTRPYPGVEDALRMASRRARLSVLTNKPIAPTERILSALGLAPYFHAVTGGDGPHGRKPSPAGLYALTGGKSDDVMVVGDSPIDWATARAAGCPFVWARYGFGSARFDGQPPDTPYIVELPTALTAVIDRLAPIFEGS